MLARCFPRARAVRLQTIDAHPFFKNHHHHHLERPIKTKTPQARLASPTPRLVSAAAAIGPAAALRVEPASSTQQKTSPLAAARRRAAATMATPPTSAAAASNGNGSTAPSDPKLAALRAAMAAADGGRGVAAYIVPTEDPHMSEYPPDCYKRREWLTNFTGSAGTAVVLAAGATKGEQDPEHPEGPRKPFAGLWTDGRYYLQAETELGPEWTLMRAGSGLCPDLGDWLAEALPAGARVGLDPWCHTSEGVRALKRTLEAAGKVVVPLGAADGNLVDKAWGAEKPPLPSAPLRAHPARWAGSTVAEKLASLRSQMVTVNADGLLVTMLDEVAWLLNARGSDVDYNPVFVAYAVVGRGGGRNASGVGSGAKPLVATAVYVDPSKVPQELRQALEADGVEIRPYEAIEADVRAAAAAGAAWMLDGGKASLALAEAAGGSGGEEGAAAAAGASTPAATTTPSSPRGKGSSPRGKRRAASSADDNGNNKPVPVPATNPAPSARKAVIDQPSPVVAAKAVKNPAELEGMREAHLRDAVALCEFLSDLDARLQRGETLTEVDVDERLTARRAAQPGFVEPSFPTIAGADANGAVIHYRAKAETCRTAKAGTLLLIDSGGQYDCGTTDVTRTVYLQGPGAPVTPSDELKRAYTRVLQGHIALDAAVFPEGTPGSALDALARLPLWSEGLNYRHGTGHGVGAALNVHEGPQSISTRYWITTGLTQGMVCSNEPGYYEDGRFGVRVENLAVVAEAQTANRFGGSTYLRFERLTLCPIQAACIDASLLTKAEEAWLDAYHEQVWEGVAPRLDAFGSKAEVKEWLRRATRPLREQVAELQEAAQKQAVPVGAA
jgi:Xaa-Pro aminopeptidase